MKYCKAMDNIFVIKIGGNIIDNDDKLRLFLKDFAAIKEKKILVHGGGKMATQLAEQLHIPQQLVDGRRITDAATLRIITMVYAGFINKQIVALLQAGSCDAVGLCGADGNLIQAHKREHPTIDYGFVGDIDKINISWLGKLLNENVTLVIAPVTHDKEGQLLNTNADTIAQEIAVSLATDYNVNLIYCFEKIGVLQDAADENTLIPQITLSSFATLREQKVIHSGMIPKLHNAFTALESGVKKVMIGKGEELDQLISGTSGTTML